MKNTTQVLSTNAQISAEQFAMRVTARLSEGNSELPYDITERLRAARTQALAKRKLVSIAQQSATPTILVNLGSSAALGRGGEKSNWWNALVSAIPILALVVGLVVINTDQDERSAIDVAEVDAALLTDDLPPAAYADPGFVQFLKMSATTR
ncbi:MAG: DUF3619 family protein [Burkholderiaceae bacterium]|nr:DUF3619 family protein [Burkholderiaceae bacterium]